MESKSKIAAALVNAKKAFNPALKNATNPHLKNKYANLEACLNAVDDALLANGIFLYQETSENETGVTVETIFLHESGEELRTGKLHVPAPKQDPQGYGSALTYARRYSLVTSCGIAQEDDDGNAGSAKQQSAKPLLASKADYDAIYAEMSQRDIANAEWNDLTAWLNKGGWSSEDAKEKMEHVKKFEKLPVSDGR